MKIAFYLEKIVYMSIFKDLFYPYTHAYVFYNIMLLTTILNYAGRTYFY